MYFAHEKMQVFNLYLVSHGLIELGQRDKTWSVSLATQNPHESLHVIPNPNPHPAPPAAPTNTFPSSFRTFIEHLQLIQPLYYNQPPFNCTWREPNTPSITRVATKQSSLCHRGFHLHSLHSSLPPPSSLLLLLTQTYSNQECSVSNSPCSSPNPFPAVTEPSTTNPSWTALGRWPPSSSRGRWFGSGVRTRSNSFRVC